MLAAGRGRARDDPAALRWFLRAARAGHRDAAFNAGVMLEAGLGLRAPDLHRALVLYAVILNPRLKKINK